MSIFQNKPGNLLHIFNLKTLKGRFIWLSIFFIFIFLGFSLVMLLQNQKIEKKLNQVMDVRLMIRKDIEDLSSIATNLISNTRNNILKRLPFNEDDSGNYQQYTQATHILKKLDSLQGYFPDSTDIILSSLTTNHEQFNQDFKRADSVWDKNNGYYKLLNIRDKILDKADVIYKTNDQNFPGILSDTIKITTIEAEDAFYAGAFINYSHLGYEGTGYADYVNATDDYLEAAFQSEKAGNHLIFYRYALGRGSRHLDIFIDDNLAVEKFAFNSKDNGWDKWFFTDTISLSLDAGIHKIKAVATGNSGPNIDKIYIISPAGDPGTLAMEKTIAAIPDSLNNDLNIDLFTQYRHEVNTMSAVEDIMRASLNVINSNLGELYSTNERLIKADDEELKSILKQTNIINFSLLGLMIIVAIVLIYIFINSLKNSLNHPLNLMKNLSAGDITKKAPATKDEFNQVIEAGNQLREHLQKASDFANKIGEGNLESSYQPSGDKDVLGKALLQMRDKLKLIAEEERKNNWSSKGVTLFADMVRKQFDNLDEFSAIAISQLVKYLDAKLGMLYIKNDQDEEQVILELKGCYAYDRNKYLDNTIEPGYGYAGQVFLEKETVYLTDLPEDYVKIGSSLGETPPRSLLVVPLIANDVTEGVLEIASLIEYEKYQIDFVEKVAEIFATHIVNVRINEKTNLLLEESKKQTEEMKAQEEELRQNMEELEAMHEQMRRDKEEEQQKD